MPPNQHAPTTGAVLDTLNDAQRRAVEHAGGPLIVLAGPGTGKTRVIIARIHRLVEGGADPASIVALTFTTKAAEEMEARLAELVAPPAAAAVRIGTYHAFSMGLVRRFGDMLGLPPTPAIMDSAQERRLVRAAILETNAFPDRARSGREVVVEEVLRFARRCREQARSPRDAIAYAEAWAARLDPQAADAAERARQATFAEAARVFAEMDRRQRERGLLTLDDLILLPQRLVDERPVVGDILRSELRHFVVDEFQDVNAAQIELLRRLAPPRDQPDLCVVGDDDQAIYAFRGADAAAFGRFEEVWSSAARVRLETTYRSGPPIVAAAGAIIERAPRFDDEKRTIAGPGTPADASVEGIVVAQDDDIGPAIAAAIRRDRVSAERPWDAYAVIARTNGFADQIATFLGLLEIPVSRRRRLTPLDDQGVQDVLAWIRLVLDPDDTAHAQRLLVRPPLLVDPTRVQRWIAAHRRQRGVGGADQRFLDWLAEHEPDDLAVRAIVGSLAELRRIALAEPADVALEHIVRISAVAHAEELSPAVRADRVESLVRMLRFVRERRTVLEEPGDLAAFWSYYQDLDEHERTFEPSGAARLEPEEGPVVAENAVTVITAHAAKGLEFDTVFVARVRPGHGFPQSARRDDDPIPLPPEFTGRPEPDHHAEERRLFYVACTRAERRLVLLAKRKKRRGKTIDYFIELEQDAPDVDMIVTDAEPLLEDLALADRLDAGLHQTVARRSDLLARLDREASRVRHELLARALAAEHAGLDAAGLDDLATALDADARTLAAIAHLRRHGSLPDDPALPAAARQRLLGLTDAQTDRALPEPPLRLSYTSIELYQTCPRCWYLQNVLGLAVPWSPHLALGNVVHRALEQHVGRWRVADADGGPLPGPADLQAAVEREIARQWPAHAPLDPDLRDRATALAQTVHDRLDDATQILELEQRVEFPIEVDGVEHHVVARIDRVDQLADGGFRIVDYKTGNARQQLREPRRDDLQLCLYAMALPRLLDAPEDERLAGVAEYWLLVDDTVGSIPLAELDLDGAREAIAAAARGILAGRFERDERSCRGACEILPPWY